MVEVHRSQAHALAIRARAEMRLAEEYDAAQDRGEVSTGGGRPDCVEDRNAVPATAADLGLRRDEIHAARKLRDAEKAEPGIVARTINDMVEQGEDQTRPQPSPATRGSPKTSNLRRWRSASAPAPSGARAS